MSQVSRSCQETQLCALQSRRPGKTSHRLGNVSYASESTNHYVRGMTVLLDHSHSKHSWNVTSLSKSWAIRIHIVIYIESCNVMHTWSLFTSDGSVAISKCSAKASCTSSAPRLLPLEDLFPAKFVSNFSKIYIVSFWWSFKSNVSLTFTAHAYGITISHGILLASMTFSLSTPGAFSYFPQGHYFHSQTPRLPDFTLPDSIIMSNLSRSFFGLVLLSFLPTFFFGLLFLCELLLNSDDNNLSEFQQRSLFKLLSRYSD